MFAFGNISFILKTITVTYIVFEESSAVGASSLCDYLDKYPVTIRSVLDTTAGAIESCILEQIDQNSSLLVEETQINNFIQLLDMENLDEYLDLDEKEKGCITDKPLLEVGNEEIIATEDEDMHESGVDDADVDAIEKQALLKQCNHSKIRVHGVVLVDRRSAQRLNLSSKSLRLTQLPQLNVIVQDYKKANLKKNEANIRSKSELISAVHSEIMIDTNSATTEQISRELLIDNNTDFRKQLKKSESVTLNVVQESMEKTPIDSTCSSLVKTMAAENEFNVVKHSDESHAEFVTTERSIQNKSSNKIKADHNASIPLDLDTQKKSDKSIEGALSKKHTSKQKRLAYVSLKKLDQTDIKRISRSIRSPKLKEETEKRKTAEEVNVSKKMKLSNCKIGEANVVRDDVMTEDPNILHFNRNEANSHADTIISDSSTDDRRDSGSSKQLPQEKLDANQESIQTDTSEAFVERLPDSEHNELTSEIDVIIKETIPAVCSTVEIGLNESFISEDEGPLVIDLPAEQMTKPTEIPLTQGENNVSFIVVDEKSASALSAYIQNNCRLYLDNLPRLKVKLKRLNIHDYKISKKIDRHKPKSSEKTNKKDMVIKKREGTHIPEKPRQTDLEKIDNKFLPAGSKLKSQAKARSKPETSHRHKHVPVPELPIELKAHLNTSFKIPKKNVAAKYVSIERNPSELDCLHRDQNDAEKQRKRFHKERRKWENRIGRNDSHDKNQNRTENPPRVTTPEFFDTSFDEHCDSPPHPGSLSTVDEQNTHRMTKPIANREQHGASIPSFEEIWGLQSEKTGTWDKEQSTSKRQNKLQTQANNKFNKNTIDSGESWSPGATGKQLSASSVNTNIASHANFSELIDDRMISKNNTSITSNTINDGESWSPIADKDNVQGIQNKVVSSNDQNWKQNQLASNNSRTSERQQRNFTIASGDMWDSDPVIISKQSLSMRNINDQTRGERLVNETELLTADGSRTENIGFSGTQSKRDQMNRTSPLREGRGRDRYTDTSRQRDSDYTLSNRSPSRSLRSNDYSPSESNRSVERRHWSRECSPNRRKYSRSPTNRRIESRERSPRSKRRAIDYSPERGTYRRSTDPWDRSNLRSPNERRSPGMRRRNIDRSPLMRDFGHYINDKMYSPERGQNSNTSLQRSLSERRSSSPYSPRSPSVDKRNSPGDLDMSYHDRNSSSNNRFDRSHLGRFNAAFDSSRSPPFNQWDWKEQIEPPREKQINSSGTVSSGLWENQQDFQDRTRASSAYSPSSALEALSSEDECDFTNPKYSSSSQQLVENAPVHIHSSSNLPESLSNEESIDKYTDDTEYRYKQIHPRDCDLLSNEDKTEKQNVLESLKYRAERLKKLEDMKLARQKLLAQIKLNNQDSTQNELMNSEPIPTGSAVKNSRLEYTDNLSTMAPPSLLKTADALLSNLDFLLNQPPPYLQGVQIPTKQPSFGNMVYPLPNEAPPSQRAHDTSLQDLSNQIPNVNPEQVSSDPWKHSSYCSVPTPNIDTSQPPPHLLKPLLNFQPVPSETEDPFVRDQRWSPDRNQNQQFHGASGRFHHPSAVLAQPRQSLIDYTPDEEAFQLLPAEEIRTQNSNQNRSSRNNSGYTNYNDNIQHQRDPRQNRGGVYPPQNSKNQGGNRFNQNQRNQRFNFQQQNRFNRNNRQFPQQHMFRRNIFSNFDESCFDMNFPVDHDRNTEWAD
ncbi:uncharacterized protein LOC131440554 [Malaya genurostris]|uniref:uncharacterized protein LOC131440554 n=1 Tax=Malaya genurostris TaxID=325434 RepID=UPI0026F3AA36|nr:uncharacterized protein LOC131440554 [Malaya genurostris]